MLPDPAPTPPPGADVLAVLQRAPQERLPGLTGLVQRSLPVVGVSVTVLEDGGARSLGVTAPVAGELDGVQYDAGRGPCLAAPLTRQLQDVPDTRADERWERLGRVLADRGVLSVLSVPLPGAAAGLNLYAAQPGVLAARQREAVALAALVGLALEGSGTGTRALADDLDRAGRLGGEVREAVAVLAAERGVLPAQALSLLVERARASGSALAHEARRVLDARER